MIVESKLRSGHSFISRFLRLLVRLIYRFEIKGPKDSRDLRGVFLICERLSAVEVIFLSAALPGDVLFLFEAETSGRWQMKFLTFLCRAVVLDRNSVFNQDSIRELAQQAKRNGSCICISAEKMVSEFDQAADWLTSGGEAVPCHVDHALLRSLNLANRNVTVYLGDRIPANAESFEVFAEMQKLSFEAWQHSKQRMPIVPRAIVRTARRHPFRVAMAERSEPGISFIAALARSVYFGRRLKPLWRNRRNVGILLPPSTGGAICNQAALLMGKVPVNLNYTLPPEALASCIDQCGIDVVVTSTKFLTRLKISLPVKAVFLEELVARPTLLEKLFSICAVCFLPESRFSGLLSDEKEPCLDDLATIIFTSGSTGVPKGVMLSHYNVMSNIGQAQERFQLRPDERVLGVLPFFHSFGFTGTLLAPAVLGVGVVYHNNPRDGKAIGELIQEHQVTVLVATPTLYQLYLRGFRAEQTASVKYAVAGAEKMSDNLLSEVKKRFGIPVFEAYGCTECSPVVAVDFNRHDVAGGHQSSNRTRGTVGSPLSGIRIRIVDPDSGENLSGDSPGLLLIKGPNIMQGYLGKPDDTVQVQRDGWYLTGDIAQINGDGSLTIIDRISRFSKIGGEMVPHLEIERILQDIAGEVERVFLVVGIPDRQKGEKIVVLHTLAEDRLGHAQKGLSVSNAPNLWKPKNANFISVSCLPLLGTGKIDFVQAKRIAKRTFSLS